MAGALGAAGGLPRKPTGRQPWETGGGPLWGAPIAGAAGGYSNPALGGAPTGGGMGASGGGGLATSPSFNQPAAQPMQPAAQPMQQQLKMPPAQQYKSDEEPF